MPEIKSVLLRPPPRRVPMVVAVFSFRYDAPLVPALIENITPSVHGYVSCDDRGADGVMSSEPERRNALHAAARDMGADWILAVDPDERFEPALQDRIGSMTAERRGSTLWVFKLREMVSPDSYRVDGIWGQKTQMRLYPAAATLVRLNRALHGPWIVANPRFRQADSGLNLYHLRHMSADRGRQRRDTYALADPERRLHLFGYDYLADERGMRVQRVSADRAFCPAHVNDTHLWASPVPPTTAIAPDPIPVRLALIAALCRYGAPGDAARIVGDLCDNDPADLDLRLLQARLLLRAGAAEAALVIVRKLPADFQPLAAQIIAARALGYLDGIPEMREQCAFGPQLVKQSPMIARLCPVARPIPSGFAAQDARWRYWVHGKAQVREGNQNGLGPLAVVVIGMGSPTSLRRAVASVRDQSAEAEIVVVNSGGGDALAALGPFAAGVRLVTVEERLFVGAARNIGIDASRAQWIAFLAADCVAQPGWIAGRVMRHAAGAAMVSSAVAQPSGRTLRSILTRGFLFPRRGPDQQPDDALHYGRSYSRLVFAEAGYFAPGLRVGEDTEFHSRAGRVGPSEWAPDVIVVHDDPPNIVAVLRDIWRRAQRSAPHLRPVGVNAAKGWIGAQLRVRHRSLRLLPPVPPSQSPLRRVIEQTAIMLGLAIQGGGYLRAGRRLARADIATGQAEALADKNLAAASHAAARATALAPQMWQSWQTRGRIALMRGSNDALPVALRYFRRALALSPTARPPVQSAVSALLAAGRAVEALAFAEDALFTARGTRAHCMSAARAAERLGLPDLALWYLFEALAANPANPKIHSQIARLHDRAGQSARARVRDSMAKALRERVMSDN